MRTIDRKRANGLPIDGKAAEAEGLRRSEERWRSLVRNAPDFILCIDRVGRIEFANRTVPPYRPDQVLGTQVWDYIPRSFHGRFRRAFRRVIRSGRAQQIELMGEGPSGSMAWYVSRLGPIRRDGKIVGAVLVSTDITARKRAEDALRESEEKFRRVYEKAWDAIFVVDMNGRILDVNPAGCRSLGYTRQELLKLAVRDFAVVSREELRAHFRDIANRAPVTIESIHRRKDGSTFPVEVHAGSFELGGRKIALGLARDVSHRKRAEQAELVSRAIVLAQEAERRRVARELHDSVGQLLSSAKMRVQACGDKLRSVEPSFVVEAQRVMELLDRAIGEIRGISRNLRPSILDDLGLVAAARSVCVEFADRTGIRVRFRFPPRYRRLSQETEVNLYRILQEALSNVERHARATRVDVALIQVAREVRLAIRDNGRGIRPRRRNGDRQGVGLVNIRERAGQIGGVLAIHSPSKGGTEIAVRAPLGARGS